MSPNPNSKTHIELLPSLSSNALIARHLSITIWSSLWVIFFFGSHFFAPFLPKWPEYIAKFLSATLLIILSFGFIYAFSKLSFHRNVYLFIGLLGIFLVSKTALPFINKTTLQNKIGGITGTVLLLNVAQIQFPVTEAATTIRNELFLELSNQIATIYPDLPLSVFLLCLCQLLVAAGIGLWIGNGIDKPGHLLPIAIVAGIVDIWSVSVGATSFIIQSSTIHYFLLRFPYIGGGNQTFPLLIGLTDFLFFGIFFQSAVRFDLNVKKNVILLGIAFISAVTAALFFEVGLPVLPFMAICFLGGNYRKLTLTKEEIIQMATFLIVVAIVGYFITKFLHS